MSFVLTFSGVICADSADTGSADVNCSGVGAEEASVHLGEQLGVVNSGSTMSTASRSVYLGV